MVTKACLHTGSRNSSKAMNLIVESRPSIESNIFVATIIDESKCGADSTVGAKDLVFLFFPEEVFWAASWNFVGDLRCRKTLLEEDDEDGEENKGSSIYKPDTKRGVKAFMVI
nr:hypothetical protein CFP56_72177 [Quercus suber]